MKRRLLTAAALLFGSLLVGRTLSSQGLPAQPAVAVSDQTQAGALADQAGCPICHGRRGEAPLANVPSLAGQYPAWLKSRLEDFRQQGKQGKPGVMPRYARNLTDAQIAALANAYSKDPLPVPPRMLNAAQVTQGQHLYQQGNPAGTIIACATCHQPTGAGTTMPLIPAITGQHAGYVTYRLRTYRRLPVEQGHPGAQAMRSVAHSLSDDQIQAVAAYVEQLPVGSFK